MKDRKAKEYLELMEQYESVTRDELIYNVHRVLDEGGMDTKLHLDYMAKISGTKREVAYSWFGPTRHYKVPLKVLAQMALDLQIPMERLLDRNIPKEALEAQKKTLRRRTERKNYRQMILDYRKKHPDETVTEIAKNLGVSRQTVNRHLLRLKEGIPEDAPALPDRRTERSLKEVSVYRMDFEAFKSTICHMVKDLGDFDFIIDILGKNLVRIYWEREWYPEAFYLLAMVDYLSRIHNLPVCENYADIRCHKLEEPLFPRDVRMGVMLSPELDMREQCLKEAIPEFLRHNIVEAYIRDVV